MRPATSFFFFAFLALAVPGTVFALPLDLVKNLQDLKVSSQAVKLADSLKSANTEAFCSVLDETKKTLETAVGNKEEAVSEYVKGVGQNLDDERNARDAKLGEARSVADQERSEWYAALDNRAESDDQKAAVMKYRQRVEEAVDDRRAAVDSAIFAFRKAIDALVQKRSIAMESASEGFKASVETATEELEKECQVGIATASLVKDFKSALKAGRDKLAADKKAALALQTETKALADIRKKSIAAAVAAFQSEMIQANKDLETAFAGGE